MSAMSLVPRLLPLVALLPVLAGCGPERNAFAPACPTPLLVRELADIARYRPNATGRDLTDLIVQARVVRIDGSCVDGDKAGTVASTLSITLEATRGPAMTGKTIDLPLLMAVADGESIRDKRSYAARITFDGNLDRVSVSTPPIDLQLPVTATKSAAAYSVIAGFQLSPEEVAANRYRAAR